MANDGTLLFDTSIDPKGFSEGVSKIGGLATKAVAAVGAALGMAAIAATKVGAEFETSLAKVSTIADTTHVSMESLSSDILKTSSDMGIAASDIAEATYQAISAGQATEDAVAFAGKASMLAAAGFADSSTAVDLLTTALNAYGMSADEADHVSDVLLTTQNLGKTTVDELASSMGRVIPLASAYGVSVENLSADIAVLTQNGIATAEATTYTKSMLNELGDSGSQVAKTLQKETGKSFSELMQSGKSLGDVLEILYDSTGKDGTAFSQMWSSVEAGTGALSLAGAGAEKFNGVLNQMETVSGLTEEAYGKMSDTLEHKMSVLSTNAQNLGIAFYQSTDEQIGGAVDLAIGYMGQLTEAFQNDGLEGLAATAGSVIADLAAQIVTAAPALIDTAVSVIQSFVDGLSQNTQQIVDGAIQIMTSLVGGIVSVLPSLASLGVQIIGTFLTSLTQQLPSITANGIEWINSLASGIAEQLPILIGQALPMILSFCETLRSNFGQIVDAGINLLLSLVDGLIAALPDLIAYVPQIVIEIAGLINDNAPKILKAGFDLICKLVVGLVQAIPEILAAMPKIVEAIFSVIQAFNWLDLGKNIMTLLRNGITAMTGAIKAAGDSIFNTLKGALQNLPNTLLNLGRNAIQLLSSGVSGMVGAARGAASAVFSGIVGAISSLPSQLWNLACNAVHNVITAFTSQSWGSIGSNIINGIVCGIGSAVGGLVDSAVNAAKSAFNAAKRALGIHSPSKLFADEIGAYIPPGMTKGIEKAMPKAEDDVRDSMDEFVSAAQSAVSQAQSATTERATTGTAPSTSGDESGQNITVTGKTEAVLVADGRELARVTAPYMGEQMEFEDQ